MRTTALPPTKMLSPTIAAYWVDVMCRSYATGYCRRMTRRILRLFAIIERPAAWTLLCGGVLTFGGVLVGLIAVGEARWATLLISADLIVGGFSAVQETEGDE